MSAGETRNAGVPVGLRARKSLRVSDSKTVPQLYPEYASFVDMPAVFATGFYVGFIEYVCLDAMLPYLAQGERSVGIHVDVSHEIATLPGVEITAEVECTAVDGRRVEFAVRVHDEFGNRVGAGRHVRCIVDLERFLQRARAVAEGRR